MRILLLIFTISISLSGIAQLCDDELLKAIRLNESSTIKSYFRDKSNDPNRLYGKIKVPLIHYAISVDKSLIVEELVKAGADINKMFNDDTPLMLATCFGYKKTAETLLKLGAIIDLQNKKGQTTAIIASICNQPSMLSLLHKYHANFSVKDKDNKTALDYAYNNQHIECYKYLCQIEYCKFDKIVLPDYFDGPYIFWLSSSKIKLSYLMNDSIKKQTTRIDSMLQFKKGKTKIRNKLLPFEIDIRKVNIKDNEQFEFNNVKKIMAIGDIHGEFNELVKFLINNKVIDNEFNWIFGEGHLLLAGDIFDRGNKVSECFWLIYKLEEEAEKHGGKVHFILGNHELLQITGYKAYLGEKYLALFNKLRIDYTDFYGPNTELGGWLRSKNTIIKLNNLLFVHGGLSPELLEKKMNIKEINKTIKDIINRKKPETQSQTEDFLLGQLGPLWYRGYLKPDDNFYRENELEHNINEEKIDKILAFYGASAIIFAHTHMKEITPMYNFKLYGIDVPFAETKTELQALFIQNERFYRAYINGKLELLH